jgi:hypothetical protein
MNFPSESGDVLPLLRIRTEGTWEAIEFIGPPFVAFGVSKDGLIVSATIASEFARAIIAMAPLRGPRL